VSTYIVRGHRVSQRYRRGAHTSLLNTDTRLALTQHLLARKSRTHQPTPADPVSITIGKYNTFPINARRHHDAILPSHHIQAYLNSDHIYNFHPSTRLYLQSPLSLQPITLIHNLTLIEKYYITGINLTNPQNDNSIYIYVYLLSDYKTYDEILDLITTQLHLL
jgi:hypothetical protein